MPVSGVVIRCKPDRAEGLATALAADPAVEIHGVVAGGKIIAVIEADSVDGEMNVVSALLERDGVIDVQLAYHNFEDLEIPAGVPPTTGMKGED